MRCTTTINVMVALSIIGILTITVGCDRRDGLTTEEGMTATQWKLAADRCIAKGGKVRNITDVFRGSIILEVRCMAPDGGGGMFREEKNMEVVSETIQ